MSAETPSTKSQWDQIAEKPAFHSLLKAKVRFLTKASIFFIAYYFALPVLVGWFPELMKREVWGKVNIAYVFALSQFFMAWTLAAIYVKKAAEWDRMAASILTK